MSVVAVSPYRTVVSGAVKTSGAIAAVFAVDPNPSVAYLILLFVLLFFWEIGGQNIPNDWVDVDEDKQFRARTIPVCFGLHVSRVIVVVSLALTLGLNVIIFYLSQVDFTIIYVIISFAVGCYLLLLPAVKLYRTRNASDAMALFNKASYYPPVLFVVVLIRLVL